jgi:hypothetical protein
VTDDEAGATDTSAREVGSGARRVADDPQPPKRAAPPRPILVEVASAFLVIGGAINLLLSIEVLIRLAQGGTGIAELTVITIALATLVLALGLAVRFGRAWLVTVNVVAVIGFLELISQTPVGLLFGVVDVLVVLALMRERPWFEASALARAEAGSGGERR